MIRRTLLFLLILSVLTLPLYGCWGKREVEQLGLVFGVGIDTGSQPGSYLVTYQIALPKKSGEGGGGTQSYTISAEGKSMRETSEKMFNTSDRQLFIGTVKVIVLGDSVAREGINSILDFFQRFYEFRRTTYLVLAKGKAKDLLNIELRTEKLVSLKLLADIDDEDMASAFPKVRLGHYLTVLGTGSTAPIIPIAFGITSGEEGIEYESKGGKEPEEIHFAGAGVFRGDRLVSTLTDEETKGYMWLQNEVKQRYLSAELDGEQNNFFVTGRIVNSKTNWKLEEKNGELGINFEVKSTADLDEFSGEQIQRSPEEWFKTAGSITISTFKKLIKDECEAALKKSKELELDFLGIGRKIEQKNPKYWNEIKDQWQQLLTDIPVKVNVVIKPQNAGASFNPPTNPAGTGQE